MKLILTISILAMILAGCADTYNAKAMPKAAAALQHVLRELCGAI